MIEEFIKYALTKEDVDGLLNGLPKRTTVCYMEGPEQYRMDYHTIKKLKNNFPMDVIVSSNFEENTFDEWLNNRVIPYYKIYEFVTGGVKSDMDIYRVPFDIDFKSDLIITLAKKVLPKIKGVPTSVEYYESKTSEVIDGVPVTTYDNIICRIDFTLHYDQYGFIYKKDAILKWYLSNGSLCTSYCSNYVEGEACNKCTKNLGLVYDANLDRSKIIEEGIERRRSIYNEMQLPALTFLKAIFPDKNMLELIGIGRDFMSYYKEDFDSFIYESLTVLDPDDKYYLKKVIYKKIAEDTVFEWLDTEVDIGFGNMSPRNFILASLDI